MLQEVEERFRETSTLEQVLDNPVIKGYAQGDELSKVQRGLVAAAVSLMQDKLLVQLRDQADELRITLERERVYLATLMEHTVLGFRQLYKTPIITLPESSQNGIPENEETPKPGRLRSIFTWGNVFGGAAILMVAVSLYFTKAYASYKDRVANQEKTITEIGSMVSTLRNEKAAQEEQVEALAADNSRLGQDVEFWKATAGERSTTIDRLNGTIAELQRAAGAAADLAPLREANTKLQNQIQEAKAELAKFREQARSETEQTTIFKRLYDEERKKYSDLWSGYQRMNKENNEMIREIDKLKEQAKRRN